jgi:cysteine desulfurase/selenocysteine lyase
MRRLGVPASSRASFAVHSMRDDVDRLIEGIDEVREVFA